MSKYTYNDNYTAHLGVYGDRQCVVPDQVSDDQHAFDGCTFPAIFRGKKIRVRLDGSDYGLNSAGTGDMVVRRA